MKKLFHFCKKCVQASSTVQKAAGDNERLSLESGAVIQCAAKSSKQV